MAADGFKAIESRRGRLGRWAERHGPTQRDTARLNVALEGNYRSIVPQ